MILMLLGMSGYLLYDGLIGYPAKKAEYDVYWPKYQELEAKKESGDWPALAKKNGWPEKVEESNWDYKIKEQFAYAILFSAIGFVWLGFFLRNKGRKLTAQGDSLTLPDGRTVAFTEITTLDMRKWPMKGLAYFRWPGTAGKEQNGCIDDFIYTGADKVLKRLQGQFKGELIELAVEEKPTDATDAVEQEVPADKAVAADGEAPANSGGKTEP